MVHVWLLMDHTLSAAPVQLELRLVGSTGLHWLSSSCAHAVDRHTSKDRHRCSLDNPGFRLAVRQPAPFSSRYALDHPEFSIGSSADRTIFEQRRFRQPRFSIASAADSSICEQMCFRYTGFSIGNAADRSIFEWVCFRQTHRVSNWKRCRPLHLWPDVL